MAAIHWVFTLNNYTPVQEAMLQVKLASDIMKYAVYGYETAPTTGTPHL